MRQGKRIKSLVGSFFSAEGLRYFGAHDAEMVRAFSPWLHFASKPGASPHCHLVKKMMYFFIITCKYTWDGNIPRCTSGG